LKERYTILGRTILHADINNCYASIEMLHHPRLRGHPVAVGGSAEERHGIILARNYEARAYGIKVGLALWQARQLCPDLIIVPPDYSKYMRFSGLFRKILGDYSNLVEPFGLDEAWVDISQSLGSRTGREIADEIRERVKRELGVTISVGVSFNKIFAKLGSDIQKPDATTVITEENFRETVWKLPAADLLGVGRSTQKLLHKYGINTIGDIARLEPSQLQAWLGKWGLYLHAYASGLDSSPVRESGDEAIVKSVGNSTTCPRDLENDEDAHIVFLNLAESVAERMRDLGLKAKTVQISLRQNDLCWFERQVTLSRSTYIATELCAAAMGLLRQHYDWKKPLRSIGIRGVSLVPMNANEQLSLLDNEERRDKSERIEYTIDDIRRRFGHNSLGRALLFLDPRLGRLNAKADHTIHPVGYR
jgi:DNA polymerase-4